MRPETNRPPQVSPERLSSSDGQIRTGYVHCAGLGRCGSMKGSTYVSLSNWLEHQHHCRPAADLAGASHPATPGRPQGGGASGGQAHCHGARRRDGLRHRPDDEIGCAIGPARWRRPFRERRPAAVGGGRAPVGCRVSRVACGLLVLGACPPDSHHDRSAFGGRLAGNSLRDTPGVC